MNKKAMLSRISDVEDSLSSLRDLVETEALFAVTQEELDYLEERVDDLRETHKEGR